MGLDNDEGVVLHEKIRKEGYSEKRFLEVLDFFFAECGYELVKRGYQGEEYTSYGERIDPLATYDAMLALLSTEDDRELIKEKEGVFFFFLQGMKKILECEGKEREEMLLRYFCVSSMLAFSRTEAIMRRMGRGIPEMFAPNTFKN